MSSNGVALENKTILTPPPPLHSKLGCLLSSTGTVAWTVVQHCMEGWETDETLYFPFFKLAKCQRPLRVKFLWTYFVTDYRLKILNLNLILTSNKNICLQANLADWGSFENENFLRCIIGERTGEYGVLGDSCWNSLRHGHLAHSKAFLYTSNEASCKDINPE